MLRLLAKKITTILRSNDLLNWTNGLKYIQCITGQYGIPKPFYFPFMKSYWCGDQQMVNDGNELGHGGLELNGHSKYMYLSPLTLKAPRKKCI